MHSLHVVHVGIMGNIHYWEIVDFIVGWAGYDVCNDDKATLLAKQEAASKSRLAAASAARPEAPAKPPPPPTPAKDTSWWNRPKPGPPQVSSRPLPKLRRDPEKIDVGPLDAQP